MAVGRPLTLAAATIVDLLVAAVIALAVAFALGFAARGAGWAAHPALPLLSLIGSLLAGIVLWAWRRATLPSPTARATPADWGLAILAAVGLQALAIAYGLMASALGRDSVGSNIGPVLAAYDAAPVLTLLFAVVVAPLGEELVFRRVLLHRFAPGTGSWINAKPRLVTARPKPG